MAEDINPKVLPAAETRTAFLSFRPYPFKTGHKIFIESGPRHGDWEVIGVSERKVRLRCPFSGREVEWDRFCYLVDEHDGQWPHPE